MLESAHFISVQVLNEYVATARRKFRREWGEITGDLELIRESVESIRPIDGKACWHAVRIAERYKVAFYDAVMIAVALANGATVLYSEDMQHGFVIDGTLTITNPFLTSEPA